MREGERFEAVAEALAFGGDGVTHAADGRTVFVPYAAPGDRLELEATQVHKTYARAKIRSLLAKGPARVEAPCPVFSSCGGCQWQHLDYPSQLSNKENFVRESLRRIGGFSEPPLKPIVPAPSPMAYRNKAIAQVTLHGFGFYRESSHEVVALPAQGCGIQSEASNAVLRYLAPRAVAIPGLKQLAVRSNGAGETLVALVSAQPLELDGAPWFKDLPGLKGVVNNLQPKEGNAVFGAETRLLSGKSFIVEELDGLKFRLSATSFFQVNSAQALGLWKLLLQSRPWVPGEEVLELYSGVGTLSLPLARLGVNLLGIENWAPAVEDARLNAELNGLKNAQFECADARQGLRSKGQPQVLVLDPPRKGLSPEVLAAIIEAAVPEILYVSCDPASLSRDLKALAGAGWRLESVQPLDMFPQTFHVESLSILRR